MHYRRGVDKVGALLRARHCAAGLFFGTVLAGAAHAAPLPIQSFFAPPASREAQLSPSGRYLALVEHRDQGEAVAVIDLRTREKTTVLKTEDGHKLEWLRWKGDDRLLTAAAPQGRHDADDEDTPAEILTALDRDGGRAVALAPGAAPAHASPTVRMADPMARDPGHVLVAAPDGKGKTALWKVDVSSGSAEFVREGDNDPDDSLPPGAMVVRYGYARGVGKADDADFDVLGPADGGKVYVALQPRNKADGDVASLRVYDFARHSFSDPVWPSLKYDVSDVVYHDGDMALAGVCYTADTYECDFKDPALSADYRRAVASFKDTRNLTPLGMSDDARYWLFAVSGPTQPGAYYVYDRRKGTMTLAADRHPELPAARLAPMERFVYAARDGTEIHGYVTRPPGAPKGPLPMIVMPHGGPEARDSFSFDLWAEFFATRGYLVFQPNFRGSTGYGRKFAEAGYGQWGGRMQDDITDGVRQLISDGRADQDRICIFGASFGGYAALYGGAQTPDLYKCVASMAGVADLAALVDWEHATKGHQARYHYAARAIGDPKTAGARLKAASPVTYADGYRPPVLLIHGKDDASVPVAQSRLMEQALKKAGKDVTLKVYDGEGHTDWSPADEESALTSIADFVAAHIAPAKAG